MKDVIEAADLFCGAGGSSEGLVQACRKAGRRVDLVAVNHSPIAVKTHAANHPEARHFIQDIRVLDPRKAVPSGHLDILLAGAPCPHFSVARGGRPMSDYERNTPKEILRWPELLDIDNIIIENVREFQGWGPLYQKGPKKGRPIKERMGEYYREFIGRLEAMGYVVEARILNAADFGAATTRRRLFIQARKGAAPTWPTPTHTEETWRSASEIIDWSIEGESIFNRKKPLAEKTVRRIAAGIKKFCGEWAEPFLVMLYGTGQARSIDLPLPTVTAGGGKGGGHIALAQFILQQQSGGVARDVSKPAPTVATSGAQSLINACLVPFYGERPGQDPRTHALDKPVPTLPGSPKFGKVDFVVQVNHGGGDGGRIHATDKPLKTLTAKNGSALVEPFVIPIDQRGRGDEVARSVGQPIPTIVTKNNMCLVAPFIVKYFGTGVAHGVNEPAPTVTTKDRIGLVELQAKQEAATYMLDIRFRMLQPHELQEAMSFPKGYQFTGNRADKVRQIGNAWDVRVGRALCEAALSQPVVAGAGGAFAAAI